MVVRPHARALLTLILLTGWSAASPARHAYSQSRDEAIPQAQSERARVSGLERKILLHVLGYASLTDVELKAVKQALAKDEELTATLRDFERDMTQHAAIVPSGKKPSYPVLLRVLARERAAFEQDRERWKTVLDDKRTEVRRVTDKLAEEIGARETKIHTLTQVKEVLLTKLEASHAEIKALRAKLQAMEKLERHKK